MIKIILVEDHLVVRNGIKLLLDTQENVQVVAEANNGKEAIAYLEDNIIPDIIITDINMPGMDGIQLTEQLVERYPGIKVIILSMLNNTQNVTQAFEKGAKGYLVKNVSYDELLFAINHISNGGRYLCEELAMLLLDRVMVQSTGFANYENDKPTNDVELSERELEVLQLISEGHTNVEIADKLFLSKRTVEGHRQNLIEKAGVKNSASLIKYAVINRLVD
ncbi:two component transcriptional regulator, LuxR family [Sphingobacterium nematocida]|uniref:Two component transcriptional regulator, LuxR family n=1 Tax=Sphingobacterium nematocida TaxID=1513896 RepID=A0A1T5AS97_9SPHI|nr:response regulator transcription factor [Sphingobacterium nematocida]SKB37473.1 two component transcriptional regulator, LuxR family [Sphingobacterium nematocida]